MIPSTAPTNRLALLSFILAFFTLASFCVGLAPIPLTAWVCYPAAILTGLASLVSGFSALRQVRTGGEKRRAIALIGIWTGILTILAIVIFTSITVMLVYYGVGAVNTIWPRIFP